LTRTPEKIWEQLLKCDDLSLIQSTHARESKEKADLFAPHKIAAKLLETFREAQNIRKRKTRQS